MSLKLERQGERIQGLAEGVDRAHLRRLSRGEVEVDLELDLHGLHQKEARQLLRETIREAYEEGDRCLLIIHGRGKGSEDGAVLRTALPGWLDEPPIDRLVMAVASARPEDGGPGSSYLLLRRRRR